MSNITKFENGFTLVRDADVQVIRDYTPVSKHQVARIIVDDQYEHTFNAKSRVSLALNHTSEELLRSRITGGSFFFKDNDLVSFKDGSKKHFVHENESIQALIEHIGHTEEVEALRGHNTLNTQQLRLQSVHSNVELTVPGYQAGNEFTSQLSFAWSPFESHVSSAFMLTRLICENGMVGMTNFLNTNIPLVNRWQEHLDIASKQIQNKVTGMMGRRFEQMISQPASVRDLQRILTHITKRIQSVHNQGSEKIRVMMSETARMIDPQVHLGSIYLNSAFDDGRLSDQLPSHISVHTLWNMVTELNTHTIATEDSTANALDKFANELLFDRLDSSHLELAGQVKMNSNFNNVEAALMFHQK